MKKNLVDWVVPRICYPDTVREAASDLLTAVKGTDVSVKACTKLSADVATTWTAWATDIEAFLTTESTDPSWLGLGSQMDQIETYTTELLRWQTTINKFCDNVVSPVVDPDQIPEAAVWWKSILEWGVVGVGVVAGAYMVGQVVTLIPKPAPGSSGPSLLARSRARVSDSTRRAKARLRSAYG